MTIYRRPEGLIDPTPTVAQSLGAIIGTLGGKALTNYSQNAAISKIENQLKQQGVSPALATLAAAQVRRTGSINTALSDLIKNQQQSQNLSNYYQQRWGLSADQAVTLAGTPENIQKQEIENLTAMENLRLAGINPYGQNNQNTIPPSITQPTPPTQNQPTQIPTEFTALPPPQMQPTMQHQPTVTPQNQPASTSKRLSSEELQRLAILQPKKAEELRKQYESEDRLALDQRKVDQKDRDYALKTNEDFLKKVDADRASLEQKRAAVNSLKLANTSGNLGKGFNVSTFRNILAKITGFEGLRSEDAATYETAVKALVIADVKEIGSKNNQLIDKNMIAAAGNVLDDDNSRYIIEFGVEGGLNKVERLIETTDEIIAEDTEKYGYVQPNLSQRVYQRNKKYYHEEDKRTLNKMKKAKEGYGFYYSRDFSDPNNYLNAPEGTPLIQDSIDFFLRRNNMDPRQAEADSYKNGYRRKKKWYQKGILDFVGDYIKS